ncbi:hypothetical protein Plec18167_004373 [Paecilomyces lecythidis]|uniref:Stress-associated endoplasmic reticulum protein n=1 Tax=Paecilomyces lecythidis TaxID=3004212 RepID=A0ABR3XRD9_9EURO
MAQTPQQRRANEKYAKQEAAKRGKPATIVKQKQKPKTPISTGWIVLLAFIVCGGVLFELLRVVPEIWSVVASSFGRWLG